MQEILIRQFLLTNLVRSTPASATTPSLKFRIPVKILARALDDMAGFPFHPDKVRFEKPALFIRGTKSHYVPDEVIPLIGRFFPYFQLRSVEAGHWGMLLPYTHFLHALAEIGAFLELVPIIQLFSQRCQVFSLLCPVSMSYLWFVNLHVMIRPPCPAVMVKDRWILINFLLDQQ